MRKIYFPLTILLLISIVLISACSSSNQNPASRQQRDFQQNNSRFRGGMGNNFSEEERQQMMQERMKIMETACKDKKEGDSCIIQSQRGEITGICKTQNEKLLCAVEFNRNQSPNGNNKQASN